MTVGRWVGWWVERNRRPVRYSVANDNDIISHNRTTKTASKNSTIELNDRAVRLTDYADDDGRIFISLLFFLSVSALIFLSCLFIWCETIVWFDSVVDTTFNRMVRIDENMQASVEWSDSTSKVVRCLQSDSKWLNIRVNVFDQHFHWITVLCAIRAQFWSALFNC